jgi:hypothetical protein
MADNEADCRENGAVKKAPGDVVNDLYDSCRLSKPHSATESPTAQKRRILRLQPLPTGVYLPAIHNQKWDADFS